jgi:damage-control phosphatase, subfamily I
VKTYIECYPCFLRQAISAARYAGCSEDDQFVIMQQVLDALKERSPGETPPEIASVIHRIVRDHGNTPDPYQAEKQKATAKALKLYPELSRIVADTQSDKKLEIAMRISIAGNIIDLGVHASFDMEETLERVLHQPFAINHMDAFEDRLNQASSILFFGDNAGETVFDRVLIEHLPVPVTYIVKGSPVLNDATLDDAVMAGLDQCTTLISSGSDIPGTVLDQCSPDVRSLFDQATLVIAKGQGNYETLSEASEKVFNLLQVKCPVIARDIGAPVGSIVVKQVNK